jgi:hypothetical protein
MVATIGYGWDTLEHYDKWFGVNGEKTPHDILINLKGPILELGGYHTEYSERVLNLFKEVMLKDAVFIKRLETHYVMFKKECSRRRRRR